MNKEAILVAGLGTMGTHYLHNLTNPNLGFNCGMIIGMDHDFEACRKAKQSFPNAIIYHIVPSSEFMSPEYSEHAELKIGRAGNVASIIAMEKVNGFIGATQTDSHISVLKDALSAVDNNGKPLIQRILQEKPFGLFDENSNELKNISKIIIDNDIHFGLDSILMFSDIWKHVDSFLQSYPKFMRTITTVTYGKDRTSDMRPAYEGVFGTEGTHAIDLARGTGILRQKLKNLSQSQIVQGPIGINSSVPISCRAMYRGVAGSCVNIDMSLVFNENYRQAVYGFYDSQSHQSIEVELLFDHKGSDHMIIRNAQTQTVICKKSEPSNVKLSNAMCSVFNNSGQFSDYNIQKAMELRTILKALMDSSNAVTKVVSTTPRPSIPVPFS